MNTQHRQAKARSDANLVEDSIFDDKEARQIKSEQPCEWIDHASGRVLTDHLCAGGPATQFMPLKRHGMFLKFADLEPTEAAFKSFADENGLLTEESRIDLGKSKRGEHFSTWARSHRSMSQVVSLWRRVKDGTAGEVVYMENELRRRSEGAKWFKWSWRVSGSLVMSQAVQTTDVDHAARCFIQIAINRELRRGHSVRIVWHPTKRKFAIRVVPSDLLSCMWWQFARDFLGEVRHSACKVCQAPLEIGSGAFKSSREFCSPKCKQKDHRTKVKHAKELHANGEPLKRIAKRFDTDIPTIKNWLAKTK